MPIVNPVPGGGSAVGTVVVSGTPSAGQIIVATSAVAAAWQSAPATPTFRAHISTLGALSNFGNTVAVAGNFQAIVAVQGPPQIVAAMGTVCAGIVVAPRNIPSLGDSLDYTAMLYVTNAVGSSTLKVSKSGSASTPITSGTPLDWTGTSATVVGVDLSWDAASATVTSAAGGVYFVTLTANCVPD